MTKPKGRSADRDQEPLEALGKTWRRRDEVPGAGSDQSLGVQLVGERVCRALQERGVVAGGDQRRDVGVAQDIERRASLARRSTAVSATNGLDNVLGKE